MVKIILISILKYVVKSLLISILFNFLVMLLKIYIWLKYLLLIYYFSNKIKLKFIWF